jgi:hypothetical protein
MIAPSAVDALRTHPTLTNIKSTEAGPSLMNLRVLLVDDEDGAREVAFAILTQARQYVLGLISVCLMSTDTG